MTAYRRLSMNYSSPRPPQAASCARSRARERRVRLPVAAISEKAASDNAWSARIIRHGILFLKRIASAKHKLRARMPYAEIIINDDENRLGANGGAQPAADAHEMRLGKPRASAISMTAAARPAWLARIVRTFREASRASREPLIGHR